MSREPDNFSEIEVGSPPASDAHFAPFYNAIHALIELTAHTIVVAGLLGSFRFLEMVVHYLWQDEERILFGKVPLHYIFDAADFAILVGFLTYGIYSVIRKYRG